MKMQSLSRLLAVSAFSLLAMTGATLAADAPPDIGALNSKALKVLSTGDTAKGTAMLESALKTAESSLGPKAEATDTVALNLARVYIVTGRQKDAVPLLERVAGDYAGRYGKSDPRLGDVYYELGRADFAMRDFKGANDAYLSAADAFKAEKTPDERYIRALYQAGFANVATNRGKAASAYKKALKESEKLFGADAPITAEAHYAMGEYDLISGDFKSASDELEGALAVFSAKLKPEDGNVLATHAALVPAYEGQGKSDEATPHLLILAKLDPDPAGQERPLYSVPPIYARGRTVEKVTLHLTVTPEGKVSDVSVKDGDANSDFAKAATEAVEKWRYKPHMEGGNPVASQLDVALDTSMAAPPARRIR